MMKNIFLKSRFMIILATFIFCGCETFDLNQTQDPNAVSIENLEYELGFNYVQLQLPDFVNSANSFTQRVTRQMAMGGGTNYDNAFQPVNFNGNWSTAYNLLNAIKFMEPKAAAKDDKYVIGAARVIRCYVLATLVDIYGDIPYSEALLGNENFFPKFDKSQDVYKGILSELEEAKAILLSADDKGKDVVDLYYTSPNDWIRLANTIKFKMLVTARLAGSDIGIANIGSEIQAIINSGNYINETSQDFQFQYASSRLTPQSRHPQYYDMYERGGGAYIANYMFWTMTTEKGFLVNTNGLGGGSNYDPRTGFYFFKQNNPENSSSSITPFTLPGRIRPEHYNLDEYSSFYNSFLTCYGLSNWRGQTTIQTGGFWGRDHGNADGIPPDNALRTVTGLYPIGGEIGSPSSVQTDGTKGALGRGIMPIILASYVKFLKAEAVLKIPGVTEVITGGPTPITLDAKQQLLNAISTSIDKTINFIPDFPRPGTVNTATIAAQKVFYLNLIDTKYSSLSSDDDKLELIMKEYFIASWGNGIEPYNNYRRTGFPSNFQPTLEPVSGAYFNTALYPLSSQQNNPNTPSNTRLKRVFWDKANLNLH
jgi:Starch-binding associating with outer membrane/Susd and RagB outer membrane lipoprotein